MSKKDILLVVDDVEINRIILSEILESKYEIAEAGDGSTAIHMIDSRSDISAVLLDLHMPGVSGIEVLRHMNESGKTKTIPVFVVTAVDEQEMLLDSYHLGAIDVIRKPFIPEFLCCRIDSVIELYQYRRKLESDIVKKEAHIQELMQSALEVLATAIEFRDCESGEHVKRICAYTRLLMKKVSDMYEEYHLSDGVIEMVATSAILHDVGKIAIPDHILNKPGRLNHEEYELIKSHTLRGCELLERVPEFMDKKIYQYSYDICRHHHERWDGRGYPDNLSGDEISIWAQVVSVADVYDALTSPRVYKQAYSHKVALAMIFNGECGAFNPKVLKALEEVKEHFAEIERKYRLESLTA
uniref:response regulator n=1 Tax=Agathobacter sp. TaxID=2021311 RepID=UPI004057726C